jgi:hypothetical protein
MFQAILFAVYLGVMLGILSNASLFERSGRKRLFPQYSRGVNDLIITGSAVLWPVVISLASLIVFALRSKRLFRRASKRKD